MARAGSSDGAAGSGEDAMGGGVGVAAAAVTGAGVAEPDAVAAAGAGEGTADEGTAGGAGAGSGVAAVGSAAPGAAGGSAAATGAAGSVGGVATYVVAPSVRSVYSFALMAVRMMTPPATSALRMITGQRSGSRSSGRSVAIRCSDGR